MQLPMPSLEMWRAPPRGRRAPERSNDLQLVAELDGRVVGSAGLHPAPTLRRRHTAMLGISVAAEAQGHGVGRALMQAVCDYADDWAQLLRIELTVFADNAARDRAVPALRLSPRRHAPRLTRCATASTPTRCRWRACTRIRRWRHGCQSEAGHAGVAAAAPRRCGAEARRCGTGALAGRAAHPVAPMIHHPLAPDNNAAELRAFEATCRRLNGFDPGLDAEFVDGYLCALAAGPRALPAAEWLPPLAGDTFDRVFADPDDRARALSSLLARLAVLRAQLDPEALFDDPDRLRLNPWIAEWTGGEQGAADAGPLPQAAAGWAQGFLHVVDSLPQLWSLPPDDEPARLFADALAQVRRLVPAPDGDRASAASRHPAAGGPDRDALVDEACLAVQDLRMYWVDFASRPPTRRVDAAPGRNDPCPCGSGRKFKRCHGG